MYKNFIDLYHNTKSNLFLIGEFHGTNEMPKIFIDILNEALTLNKKINVYLEFPTNMQELLNKYLENEVSYKEFLKTKFYNVFYDGRQTKAMFGIINFVKEHNDKINTYFIVGSNDEKPLSNDEHELTMCNNICKYYDSNKLNFLYVGSCHAITQKDENDWFTKHYIDNNYLPCGLHVKEKIHDVISVKIVSLSSKSLACWGTKEVWRVKYIKNKFNIKKDCKIYTSENAGAYDYLYHIKRTSPSYKLK